MRVATCVHERTTTVPGAHASGRSSRSSSGSGARRGGSRGVCIGCGGRLTPPPLVPLGRVVVELAPGALKPPTAGVMPRDRAGTACACSARCNGLSSRRRSSSKAGAVAAPPTHRRLGRLVRSRDAKGPVANAATGLGLGGWCCQDGVDNPAVLHAMRARARGVRVEVGGGRTRVKVSSRSSVATPLGAVWRARGAQLGLKRRLRQACHRHDARARRLQQRIMGRMKRTEFLT
eukprot:359258-Chlamydomonas_euryale.AAC.22